MANYGRLARKALRLAQQVFRVYEREQRKAERTKNRTPRPQSRPTQPTRNGRTQTQQRPVQTSGYPGDYQGCPAFDYAPVRDDKADPGEVVWTWVPYEEDYSQGKDRPVLVIGRDGPWLLALQLSSKDRDDYAAEEARKGRYWYDIGTGDWDRSGRPSEARVNRLLRINPDEVRRTGGMLNEKIFYQVAREVAKHC